MMTVVSYAMQLMLLLLLCLIDMPNCYTAVSLPVPNTIHTVTPQPMLSSPLFYSLHHAYFISSL